MHHLANTQWYKLLYSSNDAHECSSSFMGLPWSCFWHACLTWKKHMRCWMPGKHDNNASLCKHEVKAQKWIFNSHFKKAEGLCNPFHSNFYGGNKTQRTIKDSNMVLHTSQLPHNQSCNTWTEMKCLVTPLLLILEEMWSGECKHHVFDERQHWWIVDEIACLHH